MWAAASWSSVVRNEFVMQPLIPHIYRQEAFTGRLVISSANVPPELSDCSRGCFRGVGRRHSSEAADQSFGDGDAELCCTFSSTRKRAA